jgi:hypothetical protein
MELEKMKSEKRMNSMKEYFSTLREMREQNVCEVVPEWESEYVSQVTVPYDQLIDVLVRMIKDVLWRLEINPDKVYAYDEAMIILGVFMKEWEDKLPQHIHLKPTKDSIIMEVTGPSAESTYNLLHDRTKFFRELS